MSHTPMRWISVEQSPAMSGQPGLWWDTKTSVRCVIDSSTTSDVFVMLKTRKCQQRS
ncbi:hypothetical protein RKD18_000349 [Streptomyces phaeoluteigriseus]